MSEPEGVRSVSGIAARPIGFETFVDIYDIPAVVGFATDGAERVVHFAADLTPEQASAVWWRMTSRSDDDEARRQALHAAMADHDDPLLVALVRYVLGLPGGGD